MRVDPATGRQEWSYEVSFGRLGVDSRIKNPRRRRQIYRPTTSPSCVVEALSRPQETCHLAKQRRPSYE